MSDNQDPSAMLQQLMQQQGGAAGQPDPAQAEAAAKVAKEAAAKEWAAAEAKLKELEAVKAAEDKQKIAAARAEFNQVLEESPAYQERLKQLAEQQVAEKARLLEERSKSIIQLEHQD